MTRCDKCFTDHEGRVLDHESAERIRRNIARNLPPRLARALRLVGSTAEPEGISYHDVDILGIYRDGDDLRAYTLALRKAGGKARYDSYFNDGSQEKMKGWIVDGWSLDLFLCKEGEPCPDRRP